MSDRLTYLGHATVLIELDSVRLLTDPLTYHTSASHLLLTKTAVSRKM
ncbi:MAG TPA: MBL fold metallo-hydrolase [Chloroflexota bacterium]|nr:MBL fold metallo-hydrolase [Chloroflexota bacterium]